jgi:hypothetical protein
MAKEACNTMATAISGSDALLLSDSASRAGTILIGTLISVKHAGVAFAAHRSLQLIALACLKDCADAVPGNGKSARRLPSEWAARLWQEIATIEKVRNSTLRRSTGYALAFLSVMRSESSLDKTQHVLCGTVLSQLLALALPSKAYLQSYFDRMKFHPDESSDSFLQHSGQLIASTSDNEVKVSQIDR